jgi:hypothetical protein
LTRNRILFVLPLLLILAIPSQAAVLIDALFHLGEADSTLTTIVDSVGGHNLTLTGSGTSFSALAAPGSTQSLVFDGAGSYGGGIVSSATDNFGVETWMYIDFAPTSNQALIYNGNSASSGFGLYEVPGGLTGLFGGVAFIGTVAIPTHTWVDVALVRSGGTASVYVNGSVAATTPSAPNTPVGSLQIGGNGTAEGFIGQLDEARVFHFDAGAFNAATDLYFNQSTLTESQNTPEPTALALAGLGLVALGMIRRKRAR